MTGQVTKAFLVSIAVLLAGCQQMTPSPVAPSATSPPAPQPQPAPARPVPTYVVNLTTNGGIAYLKEPWTGLVIVNSSGQSIDTPSTVGVRCGDDPEQLFAGFVGSRAVSCTFQQAGNYAVTAAVVAQNGVTTSTAITLVAYARPSPTFYLTVIWRRVNAANASQPEYEFVVTPSDGSESLSEMHWDFGDGGGSDTDTTRIARHIYTAASPQKYTVTVTARTGSHGTVNGTTTIQY